MKLEVFTVSVLAGLELEPVISRAEPLAGHAEPQLEISGEIIASGTQSRRTLDRAVRQSISDW